MPLDFVVFGVPRSGTTAAAMALNMHPQIMCGIEYFPGFDDALSSRMPDAFEDESFSFSPNCGLTREMYRAKGGSVRIFGNKDPRYFFYLSELNAGAPECKKVCIYRPRLGFWNSWDARASDPADVDWPCGQTGFFGALELMCLLGSISDVSKCGEVLIVNYDALFFDEPNTIEILYDYLGVARSEEAAAAFRRELFSPPGLARTPANTDADSVYAFLHLRELESTLLAQPVVTNISAIDELRSYTRFFHARVLELIDRQFIRMPIGGFLYFLRAATLRSELSKLGIRSRALRAIEQNPDLTSATEMDLAKLLDCFDRLRAEAADGEGDLAGPPLL